MSVIRSAVCPQCGKAIDVNVPEPPVRKGDGWDWMRDDYSETKMHCPKCGAALCVRSYRNALLKVEVE